MKIVDIKIISKHGLHARPAVKFIQLASKFDSHIEICKNDNCVDAKNILKVLSLGIDYGDTITLKINGDDEDEALKNLIDLLQNVLPSEDI